jgi:Ca-activated chloride channel family protein
MRIAILGAALATLCVAFGPQAQTTQVPQTTQVQGEETPGALQILDTQGQPVAFCPLKHTSVSGQISGYVARVNVTQVFDNPSTEAVEAIYVFPLPHNAAVDYMEMRIGDRIIRGEIKLRDEAREIYEAARSQGYAAALLEQERPNIFVQNVANIPPGEQVRVTISYVELLRFDEGVYEFVFPMVVGARYMPGSATGHEGTGAAPDTTQVPDASRISPPVAPPGVRAGHDIDISLTLDAGLELRDIESVLHEARIDRTSATTATIKLANKDEIPNKDFILRYTAWGSDLQMGVIPYAPGNYGYFSFIFMPPAAPPADYITPKEMVFVIDTSGSMSGYPIETAKAAMRLCIQQMNPRDTFNLIAFANEPVYCFPGPVPNNPANVKAALEFLDGNMGGGGTEMLKATLAALTPPEDPEHLRVICFMSDGYVGNDFEIVNSVKENLKNARFFSFGIGNSVNRFLLDKLAEVGRGTVEYIPLNTPGDEAAQRFYQRVSDPLLTDIHIRWEGLDVVDVYPKLLPDVFSFGPVIVTARYRSPGIGAAVISGKLGGRGWSERFAMELPANYTQNEAMAILWARAKIDDLMNEDWLGQQTREGDSGIQQQIEAVALEFGIMSQYTSFVAVDSKIVNPTGTMRTIAVPVYMPEGVTGAGYGWPDVRWLGQPLALAGTGPGEVGEELFEYESAATAAATDYLSVWSGPAAVGGSAGSLRRSYAGRPAVRGDMPAMAGKKVAARIVAAEPIAAGAYLHYGNGVVGQNLSSSGLVRLGGLRLGSDRYYEGKGLSVEGIAPVGDPVSETLLDLLTRPLPVAAEEAIALWNLIGARDADIEAILLSKMLPGDRVRYLSALRLSKQLKALGPDAESVPGKIVIENGRIEVIVRSTDLSDKGLEALAGVGFDLTSKDEELHAAIGWIAIEKLAELAAQDGVVLIDVPNYENE